MESIIWHFAEIIFFFIVLICVKVKTLKQLPQIYNTTVFDERIVYTYIDFYKKVDRNSYTKSKS